MPDSTCSTLVGDISITYVNYVHSLNHLEAVLHLSY